MKSTISWGLAIGLILIAFGGTFLAYDNLPDKVPIHWNIRGQVDGYAPKSWGAWLLPGAMVLIFGLLSVLPKLLPSQLGIQRFTHVYEFVVLLILGLFGCLQVLTIAQARDSKLNAGTWLAGIMYLFFALMGSVMGKIPRNPIMGIKVPWTLASDRVWSNAHRLAGWLWMAAGLLGLVFSLFGLTVVGVVLIGVAVIAPIITSYVDSRRGDGPGELPA